MLRVLHRRFDGQPGCNHFSEFVWGGWRGGAGVLGDDSGRKIVPCGRKFMGFISAIRSTQHVIAAVHRRGWWSVCARAAPMHTADTRRAFPCQCRALFLRLLGRFLTTGARGQSADVLAARGLICSFRFALGSPLPCTVSRSRVCYNAHPRAAP